MSYVPAAVPCALSALLHLIHTPVTWGRDGVTGALCISRTRRRELNCLCQLATKWKWNPESGPLTSAHTAWLGSEDNFHGCASRLLPWHGPISSSSLSLCILCNTCPYKYPTTVTSGCLKSAFMSASLCGIPVLSHGAPALLITHTWKPGIPFYPSCTLLCPGWSVERSYWDSPLECLLRLSWYHPSSVPTWPLLD